MQDSTLFEYNGLHKKRDYLIMFLLIMCSGNPAVQWQWINIAFFCFLYPLAKKEKLILDKSIVNFVLFAIILFVIQFLSFGWNSFPAIVNYCSKLLLAYYVSKIIGVNFRVVYLNVMFFFCTVALFFWSLYVTTGTLFDIFPAGRTISVGIWGHCQGFFDIGNMRNSGPFWEPGAFAGYICLIPLLYLDNLKDLLRLNKTKTFVILAALISTFSTTGYIVIFVIILYHFLIHSKKHIAKIITIPLLIMLGLFIVSQDFIGEKLKNQLESAQEVDIQGERVDHARFSSAVFDWYYIQKHPLMGNGFHSRTRYADHQYMGDALIGFGNGFTGMLAYMGIPFMLYFLFLIYKNSGLSIKSRLIIILCIIMLLQGEYYMNYPLLYTIAFMPFVRS